MHFEVKHQELFSVTFQTESENISEIGRRLKEHLNVKSFFSISNNRAHAIIKDCMGRKHLEEDLKEFKLNNFPVTRV